MNTEELKKLANYTRRMREMGIALTATSILLALFLFLPTTQSVPGNQASNTSPGSLTSTAPDAFAKIAVEAKAAIVYDLVTGEALYEKNADAQLPLASLTKLITVYAALTKLSLDTPITIPANAIGLDGPHAFSAGQTFTLYDLARLTLTASLNDGAVAIATATGERTNLSQKDMLAGAIASLGLSQTYAVNESGLDASASVSGGYGSARDMASLAKALIEQAPTVVDATTMASVQAVSKDGKSFSVINTDTIIDTLPRLILSKTGYTDLAGGNMALVFDAGISHPIAVIVLGSTMNSRFTDSYELVSATLAHFADIESL